MLSHPINIIPINESHLPALRQVYLTSRQTTFTWMDTATFELLDFDKDIEGEHVLVAIIGKTVTGFSSIWQPDNFIHHLYVDDLHHSKGIGKALLKASIKKVGLPITLKCLEKNIKAISFYEKIGFVAIDKGGADDKAYILFELSKQV